MEEMDGCALDFLFSFLNLFFRRLLPLCLPLVGLLAGLGRAQDLGGSVLRDYPSSLALPQGRVEVSLDFLLAEDSGGGSREEGGNLTGGRLLANYGLWRRTTLMAALAYGDLEMGAGKAAILTADLALKRNLSLGRRGWIPKLAVDAGIRTDMTIEDSDILVDGIPGNDQADIVEIKDLQDTTLYARLTAGQIWGRFFPHLFLEYGHTDIDGSAKPKAVEDSSITSLNLGRSEDYLKTGASLLVKFPYKALLHLEYDYLKLFREQGLDEMDDNHILKADLDYYLTPSLVFNIGGRYATRQFNGRIPFLYQPFNQESFEQECSQVQVGVTFLFGGK